MCAWKYLISRVKHDTLSTLEINVVFPRTHILFSLYVRAIVEKTL